MEQTLSEQNNSEQKNIQPINGEKTKLLYFLGSGNMAAAIGRGLAARPEVALRLGFYDVTPAKAQALAAEVGGQAAATLAEAAEADVLLLAVKPQNMAELLADLAPLIKPGQLILTIAAGLPLAWYEQRLPAGLAMVRAMPNTSASVGAAITGLMAGALASAADKRLAEQVFAAVGEYLWLDEQEVHALTALSGSGPAYYYYFTEALAAAGEALGLSAGTAQALARQTAIGVGRLLEAQPEVSPAELRRQVTSKGGTTAAALQVFMAENALPELVNNACRACAQRSEEMGRGE